jgi:hypothetical protein
MATIWKITAIRTNGTVLKGMTANITSKDGSKPGQQEIAKILTNTYNTPVHYSHISSSDFDWDKLG